MWKNRNLQLKFAEKQQTFEFIFLSSLQNSKVLSGGDLGLAKKYIRERDAS